MIGSNVCIKICIAFNLLNVLCFWPPTMCQSCQQSSKQPFQTFSIFSTRKWQKINFTSFTNYYRSLCQTLLISKEMSIQLFHFETNPWHEFLWPRKFPHQLCTLWSGHNFVCPVKWLIIGFLKPGAWFLLWKVGCEFSNFDTTDTINKSIEIGTAGGDPSHYFCRNECAMSFLNWSQLKPKSHWRLWFKISPCFSNSFAETLKSLSNYSLKNNPMNLNLQSTFWSNQGLQLKAESVN